MTLVWLPQSEKADGGGLEGEEHCSNGFAGRLGKEGSLEESLIPGTLTF